MTWFDIFCNVRGKWEYIIISIINLIIINNRMGGKGVKNGASGSGLRIGADRVGYQESGDTPGFANEVFTMENKGEDNPSNVLVFFQGWRQDGCPPLWLAGTLRHSVR